MDGRDQPRVAETDGRGSAPKQTLRSRSVENDESGKDQMRQSVSSKASCMCVCVSCVSWTLKCRIMSDNSRMCPSQKMSQII